MENACCLVIAKGKTSTCSSEMATFAAPKSQEGSFTCSACQRQERRNTVIAYRRMGNIAIADGRNRDTVIANGRMGNILIANGRNGNTVIGRRERKYCDVNAKNGNNTIASGRIGNIVIANGRNGDIAS